MVFNVASGVPNTIAGPIATGTNEAVLCEERCRSLLDWFHNKFRCGGPQKIVTNHETSTTSQYRGQRITHFGRERVGPRGRGGGFESRRANFHCRLPTMKKKLDSLRCRLRHEHQARDEGDQRGSSKSCRGHTRCGFRGQQKGIYHVKVLNVNIVGISEPFFSWHRDSFQNLDCMFEEYNGSGRSGDSERNVMTVDISNTNRSGVSEL